MEPSLLTIVLLIVLVIMMFTCGKSMKGKNSGCCAPKETSKTSTDGLISKLDQLEKENETLKKKINEVK
ncbi:hypothetical protein ACERII_11585 [Evansella sp. AB-rgal1]|uniref:hypothetical protein n=1 Tax=Evansella sp. AB-rgal1 TaxID=3242696 RepID=UPI00359EBC7E